MKLCSDPLIDFVPFYLNLLKYARNDLQFFFSICVCVVFPHLIVFSGWNEFSKKKNHRKQTTFASWWLLKFMSELWKWSLSTSQFAITHLHMQIHTRCNRQIQITRKTIHFINRTRTIFSIRHKLLAMFTQIFMKQTNTHAHRPTIACNALVIFFFQSATSTPFKYIFFTSCCCCCYFFFFSSSLSLSLIHEVSTVCLFVNCISNISEWNKMKCA